MSWSLVGAEIGDPRSIITETIRIVNTSGTTLNDFNFFIYTDLDVGDGTINDTQMTIAEDFIQSDDIYQVTVRPTSVDANDTTFYRVDQFSLVRDDLTNTSITDFENTPTAPFERTNTDETLGWQFLFESIQPGASQQISFVTQLAPNPTQPPTEPPTEPPSVSEPNMVTSLFLFGLSCVAFKKKRIFY